MSVINLTDLPYIWGIRGLLKTEMRLCIPKQTFGNSNITVGIEPDPPDRVLEFRFFWQNVFLLCKGAYTHNRA